MCIASRFLECFALRYRHKFEGLRFGYVLKLRTSVALCFAYFIALCTCKSVALL